MHVHLKDQAVNGGKKQLMKIVLIISICLFVVKFAAYFLTNSNSILTDAVESIVNILTGAFALYSIYYAAKPKDEDHPYGHGKIEFLSSGFEGAMILTAGIGMIFKGASSFFDKDELQNLDWGLYLTVFAGAVNGVMGFVLIKRGEKEGSVTLVAEGKHLLSDTWSSVAIVFGLVAIYFTKIVWIDYVLAIVIGLMITYTGFRLVKESIDNLLDKADVAHIKEVISLLEKNKQDKWIDVHNLRVLKYGDHLHIDCHVTLPWYDPLSVSHEEVDAIGKLIKNEMHEKIEFFIHADPCVPPYSCSVCPISTCEHRKAAFDHRVEWTAANVLPDKKHGM
ncbi:MAG: cation diffusion facilitator family transporter [Bacteroidota bacterium]|nr:cation diffusion facilitator family transporter [Bacteroidota bacterium]